VKKILVSVLVAGAIVTGLAGCGDSGYVVLSPSQKYQICVEAGGDWKAGAWGEESCDLP